MSNLTDQDTKRVADLIKINIKESELPKYTAQLEHALDGVSDLAELETKDTPVFSHPTGLTTTGSADEVSTSLGTKLLQNAHKNNSTALDYIKVGKAAGGE